MEMSEQFYRCKAGKIRDHVHHLLVPNATSNIIRSQGDGGPKLEEEEEEDGDKQGAPTN